MLGLSRDNFNLKNVWFLGFVSLASVKNPVILFVGYLTLQQNKKTQHISQPTWSICR